jgi:hypothetical protein
MNSKWVALAALVIFSTGCSSHGVDTGHNRAVLYQGLAPRQADTTTAAHRFDDAAARQAGVRIRKQWEQEVRKRGIEAPRQQFANLSPDTLKKRLAKAAHDHDFQVVGLRLLRPRQLAPEIAIRTTHYLALARALGGVLTGLNPHTGRIDNRGWSYEGFFLEAQDERGVPFTSVYTFMRGQHRGGGQWARSEPLYPFPHG